MEQSKENMKSSPNEQMPIQPISSEAGGDSKKSLIGHAWETIKKSKTAKWFGISAAIIGAGGGVSEAVSDRIEVNQKSEYTSLFDPQKEGSFNKWERDVPDGKTVAKIVSLRDGHGIVRTEKVTPGGKIILDSYDSVTFE